MDSYVRDTSSTLVSGQWSVVNGHWSLVTGQCSTFKAVGHQKVTQCSHQPTVIDEYTSHPAHVDVSSQRLMVV